MGAHSTFKLTRTKAIAPSLGAWSACLRQTSASTPQSFKYILMFIPFMLRLHLLCYQFLFSETYYVRKHPQWILSSGILRVKSVFACDSSVVRSYRLPVKVLWQKWNGWFWVAQVARDYRKKSRLRKCERLWELLFFMFVSFTSIQQIMAILLKMNICLNSYYWMTFFNNTHSLPIKVCQVVV